MISIKDSVFVFDLDDTLYPEVDYQASGHKFIVNYLSNLMKKDLSYLLKYSENNKNNFFKYICDDLKLSYDFIDSLIWLYRLHIPDLCLNKNTKEFLDYIKDNSMGMAIITDGRFISQKNKLVSLGLDYIDMFVSEEWNEVKPGKKRYIEVQKRYSNAQNIIYIGDNIAKDFISPNKLGWITFGIKDAGNNIHKQDCSNAKHEALPKFWIDQISSIKNFLC